jgi:hypothetical protein
MRCYFQTYAFSARPKSDRQSEQKAVDAKKCAMVLVVSVHGLQLLEGGALRDTFPLEKVSYATISNSMNRVCLSSSWQCFTADCKGVCVCVCE